MPAIVIPRTQLTAQLRSDTVAAVNAIIARGDLPPGTHYHFCPNRQGEWGVELWTGPRTSPHGEVVWSRCVDVISAGGVLAILRGAE